MAKYKRMEPYTEIGIRRMSCFRCGAKATFQWTICSDGNQYRPMCTLCDCLLNAMVLVWAGFPNAEEMLGVYLKEKEVTAEELDRHARKTATTIGWENVGRLRTLLGLVDEKPRNNQRQTLHNLRVEWLGESKKPADPHFPAYQTIVWGVVQGIEEAAHALDIALTGDAISGDAISGDVISGIEIRRNPEKAEGNGRGRV